MATNNFKPFAVGEGANVLTDSELASRSELQTGFPFKSKADSKLMGKLFQDASAGAYALGSFTVKYANVDATGSDAEGLATNFESALTAFVDEKAPTPDLSIYATKENATLTGIATLNGQNIATVNQIPDTSHFVTDTTLADYSTSEMVEAEFSSYDKNIKAHIESELTGYASLTGAAFSGSITVQEPTDASNPATKQYVDAAVASVYKYKGSVANQSALPQSNQSVGDVYNVEDTGDNFAWDGTKWDKLAGTVDLSGYLTTANASATYLSKTDAQSTYQPVGDYATNTALATKADASSLTNYAPIANPAFTGTATLGGKNLVTVDQIPDTSTFASKTELANYLPLAGGTVTGHTNFQVGIDTSSLLANNSITTKLINFITNTGSATISPDTSEDSLLYNYKALAFKEDTVAISGSRGSLSGYEDITLNMSSITVNQNSPDSQQVTSAVTITVSNGSANQAYVKKVSIKDASATISLGSAWKWAGGSQPTVTAPSLLVLSWDNDCGIAILQTTA